jgi:protein-tyrosine phosphatase
MLLNQVQDTGTRLVTISQNRSSRFHLHLACTGCLGVCQFHVYIQQRQQSQSMGNKQPQLPNGCTFDDCCNVVWTFSDDTPFLYLGNKWSAMVPLRELQQRKITHIVNATKKEVKLHNRKIKYLRISIRDDVGVDIKPYFNKTYKFIKKAYEQNESVLVHCYAGVSRSSTIVIAFLMKEFNLTLREALEHVVDKRSMIHPNMGFFMSLTQLEKEIRGVQEPSITYNEFTMCF